MRPIAVLTLLLLAFAITQAQGWKRSDKKDNIETSYQTEKTASDEFDVDVEVHNKRLKPVRVVVRVKYNRPRPSVNTDARTPSLDALRSIVVGGTTHIDECTVVVASNGTGICSITVVATKVTGLKIVSWTNVDPGEVKGDPRIISVKPIP